jgi:prepilin-type N-terminal cleavage/methylation domain-containing protein
VIRPASHPQPGRGFTLIELLVVIAVIALLIGILLPAISGARRTAVLTRELVEMRQVGVGLTSYTHDNRGRILPGYLLSTWSSGSAPAFQVYDNPHDGSEAARLTGSIINPYPWRLMPYIDFALDALVTDKPLLQLIRDRSTDRSAPNNFYATVARNPSFGMNTTYVGGDAHRGAFFRPSLNRWGPYYIERIDQATFPSRLLAFATSRGVARDTGGQKVPGYHRIEGPWRATPTSDSVPAFVRWLAPPGRFDPTLPTTTYGHLDFRHSGKAGTLTFDLHAETLSLDQLRDMRRWCNRATTPDWHPQ